MVGVRSDLVGNLVVTEIWAGAEGGDATELSRKVGKSGTPGTPAIETILADTLREYGS